MARRRPPLLLLAALALAAVACSDDAASDGATTVDAPTDAVTDATSADTSGDTGTGAGPDRLDDGEAPTGYDSPYYDVGAIDPGLASFVQRSTTDLAARLDVDPADIEVLTAVLVEWPDTALGCPRPDTAYAPSVEDGSVIELGVEGRVYRYHSGGSELPFACDAPLDPVPATPTAG